MKWLYFILSFYIISLSVLPCADELSYIYKSVSSVTNNSSSHENGCKDDVCSPFCTCACCGISIHYFTSVSNISAPKICLQDKLETLCSEHIPSGFSGSIWQPPKLG